ncbi:type IV pilin protein [Tichowtungia aerotolerans]|uniref:Prepilin-type N-terminal cleavage/methylation domain-containing protein n=1 Tax=Tichowtungia aerotolerans TaxID=2697043 RepID=A0A6P1MBX6_9BACT|nr:type II secretion system protein [Tichowtungia aerotolerans]QHI70054.1 prepilin-type N-terminal cleavage/methylation domain-containing protein [Tichowtungia aerotolerans]
MNQSKNFGFTLVEVLIVTSIIGLLAAIGIPYVLKAYDSSQQSAKDRAVTEVEKAKGVLTLPPVLSLPGAMGLDDKDLMIQDDPHALSNLCEALSIGQIEELTIDGDPIAVGSLVLKASY